MSTSQELRQRDVRASADDNVANGGTNGVHSKSYDDDVEIKNCGQVEDNCVKCCIPCLTSHNPLPENPTFCQRFKDAFRLPPHGNLASYLQFFVVCLQIWIVLYAWTNQEALPGGNFFSLLMLFIFCAIGGYFVSFLNLPPLLGMLIVGLMLRNIPGVKSVGENIDVKWSGTLRKVALTVILTRAGLGLDIVKLKKLSWAVLRLAFIPCTAEIITTTIVSKFLLGFPWLWSFLLGCIMGALSPAVTVPSLVSLQDRRYGVDKGIPTMLLAAGGLDNVLCVTGFSVFLGIIFSDGDLIVTIFKGPIGVCVGIAYGFIAGVFLWYIPAKDCGNKTFFRSVMLICAGLVAIFGSSIIGLSGAGPLGCLTTATVAAYKWRKQRQPGETDEVAGVMALSWLIVQHFLFGLIGAAVDVNNIQSDTAGMGIATLAVGLVVRSIMSFSVTMGIGFNLKERIFVTLTWLAKATVQAAIGGLALDKVMESDNPNADDVKYATDILTISVLAIIICAPIGATLMAVLGPRFLAKGDEEEVDVVVTNSNRASVVSEVIEQKQEIIAETAFVEEEEIKPVENHKFKSELSMTLQNLAAKLEEKEDKEKMLKRTSVSTSSTTEQTGIDNPAYIEAEVGFDNPSFTPEAEIDLSDNEGLVDDAAAKEPENVITDAAEKANNQIEQTGAEPVNTDAESVNDDSKPTGTETVTVDIEQACESVINKLDDIEVKEPQSISLGFDGGVESDMKDIDETNIKDNKDNDVDNGEESATNVADENKTGKYVTVVQITPSSNVSSKPSDQ